MKRQAPLCDVRVGVRYDANHVTKMPPPAMVMLSFGETFVS